MREWLRSRSWPGIDPRAFDAVVMLAFLAVAQADIWTPWGDGGEQMVFEHRGISSAVIAVGIVPMLWRRRMPLVSAAALAGAMSVEVTLVSPTAAFLGAFIPMLIVTYSVAAYEERLDRALAGLAITATGVLVVTLSVPELRSISEVPFELACLGSAWLVGRFVFGLRDGARQAGRRAMDLEARRDQEAREAVERERARIARELHDVIAHSVSLMGVQAAAAEQVLASDPDRAREPLRAIQETARDAVEELRRLLGMLRAEADGDALSPQPGLAALEPLAEQMRAAGLPVELRVETEGDHLSPGVELSAYRIVQEALTNALKHAGGTAAAVLVRRRDGALEVEITDGGAGAGAANGSGADEVGHGLIGMRERVALYDGVISAGPDEDGGYRVRASLPDPRHP